jgi:hypothetical protein
MKQLLLSVFIFLGIFSQSIAQQNVFTNRKYSETQLTQETLEYIFRLNSFNGKGYAYFKFQAIPNEEQLRLAKNNDVKFLEYIPNNIYLISVPNTEQGFDYLLHQSNIVSNIVFENSKLSDNVLKNYNGLFNPTQKKVTLYVYSYDDIAINALAEEAKKWGEVLSRNEIFHRISIAIRLDFVRSLSQSAVVKIIDLAPPVPVTDNLPGKTNHRSSVIGSGFGRNLQGDSVVLGQWDGEGEGAHVDIDTPRVTRMHPYINNGNGQHATHVCGTMAGAGIIDPYATGMAPNAKVFGWNFYNDIIGEMDSGVRFQNVMITQNSYGYGDAYDTCQYRGLYDDVSHDLDVLVRNHTNLIHVFAAGNSQSVCGLGGYRTVFSGFQSAKNIISVGALTDQDAMSGFSSWGPVRDGRLKPEICAVGVNVYSTQNGNLYAGGWNGTSMACPGASGTIAQLVQRYHQLNAGKNPEASLMRAIVANTADDILNAGPDFKSGFGRINGLTAVKAIEQNRYTVDSVINGSVKVDSIFVSGGLYQLKIMLAWSDKEAAILASKALVNDLDLYVITPINDTIRPWILDTQLRNNLAVRGIDSINNIEQVTIDAPAQGYYKIYVKGSSVPFGPQVYAYTYERVAKAITIIYPNGSELLVPSKTYNIKWDANGVATTCNLEFSLNNGTTWTTMVSGIATSLKNYNWGAPNTTTTLARIRITAGAYSDMSDTTFSILAVVDTIKGVVCNRQVTLKWRKIASVSAYDVMQLISGSMVSVGVTTDTFYTVTNLTNNVKYWFSVRGKYNNAFGERAFGVTFTPTNITAPPLITIQPTIQPVCSGTLVTLKAIATGTPVILQQWQLSIDTGKTFVNIPFATDSVLAFTVNTAMNNIKLRAYFYNSCQNFQYTDTLSLIVDTAIIYTQQPQNSSVCIGSGTTFYAKAPSNSGSVYQWQYNDGTNGWLDIAGATDTLLNLFNLPYSQNGWQYRMSASNICDTLIPSNIATLTVKAPLDVTATGAITICKGLTATLGATATGGDSSRYVYVWSLNGTLVQSGHSSLLMVAPNVTQTYKVMLWDSCSSIAVADSDTATVNVLQPLSVTSNSFVPICGGTSVMLQAVGVGGNGNYTYGWLKGNTLLQYSKTSVITLTPSSTTQYRVFVTDSCTSKNDTANVTVFVRPALHVVEQSNPDTVCIGAQATITAIASGGNGSYTYTFIDANTNNILQFGLSNFINIPVNPGNNFILVLSDSCTVLNDSLRFKIPMRSKLGVNLTKSPGNNVCSSSLVQLNANPSGGALKNYSYQWRLSGNAAIIGNTKQINVTPVGSTTYVLTLNDGCTIASAKDSITVNVEFPDAIFSDSYSNGMDYAFFAPDQSGYKKYFWSFGDGDTTSEFQPNHRYKHKGNYSVCLRVTTFNNCDSEYCDTVRIDFNNGIQSSRINNFSYAPNPFSNEIKLNFDEVLPIAIKLFDAVGRELEINIPIQNATILSTQGLASGSYLLKLIYKDEVSYVKLVKN